MGALDRANHDEQQGDLGAARVRLISLAITSPYDPGLYERIARLCCRMSDKAEAGKWYFLCDSADSEGPACIDRFRARHGGDMRAIGTGEAAIVVQPDGAAVGDPDALLCHGEVLPIVGARMLELCGPVKRLTVQRRIGRHTLDP